MNILYLHGFRSSPQSFKANLLREALAASEHRFICPLLPVAPQAATELAAELIEDRGEPSRDWALIGSSLGGFYATHLAERYGCRCVLINPAIHPEQDLAAYVGELTRFHDEEPFEWKAEYLEQLQALHVGALTRPERYLLLAATGDELIDYRLMLERYAGAKQIVIAGSDHALSDFERYLPEVIDFCLQSG